MQATERWLSGATAGFGGRAIVVAHGALPFHKQSGAYPKEPDENVQIRPRVRDLSADESESDCGSRVYGRTPFIHFCIPLAYSSCSSPHPSISYLVNFFTFSAASLEG